MQVTKCDKCDNIFSSYDMINTNAKIFKLSIMYDIPPGRIDIDLCPKCQKEFMKWLGWEEMGLL